MFDPEDNKRTVARQPLFDRASIEGDGLLRSRTSARATAPVARNANELLNRLGGPAVKPKSPVDGTQPVRLPEAAVSEKITARLLGWFKSGKTESARTSEVPDTPAYVPAANSESYTGQQDRPLIDLTTILTSVWQVRKIIVVLTVVGAVGGVFVAISTPSVYVAESKLYVDPREVRLTDSDLSKESLATEAILALVDSYLTLALCTNYLDNIGS